MLLALAAGTALAAPDVALQPRNPAGCDCAGLQASCQSHADSRACWRVCCSRTGHSLFSKGITLLALHPKADADKSDSALPKPEDREASSRAAANLTTISGPASIATTANTTSIAESTSDVAPRFPDGDRDAILGEGRPLFEMLGMKWNALAGHAWRAAMEVAESEQALPGWAIALIIVGSILMCCCCLYHFGLCNFQVQDEEVLASGKTRRKTSLYESLGVFVPKDNGPKISRRVDGLR